MEIMEACEWLGDCVLSEQRRLEDHGGFNVTGSLLWPASDSRNWCWPSRPSTEQHPSTSKHWSYHTPQLEHFAPLHQLAGWYRHLWEQIKVAQQSQNALCFGTSVVEQTPDQCQDSRVTLHLLQKTQDSFVQPSPLTPHSMTPPPPINKKQIVCTFMFVSLAHHSTYTLMCPCVSVFTLTVWVLVLCYVIYYIYFESLPLLSQPLHENDLSSL